MKKELYFEKDKTTQLTLEECLIKCKSLTTGKLIQKWSNVYERDDLIQMANIGIINAYNSYDVKYKSPFIQYAEYFIRREINNEYTKDNRDKRKANIEACSLNIFSEDDTEEWINQIEDRNTNIEQEVINNIENSKLKNAISELKPSYKKILQEYYFQGKTCEQISKEEGVCRQTIVNRLKLIKRDLKENMTGIKKPAKKPINIARTPNKNFKYVGIDKEGKEYFFNSIRNFAKEHSLSEACIWKVVSQKTKTHKGWQFARIS